MTNTMRQIKQTMKRMQEKPDEEDAIKVSNRCPHNVTLGSAFYPNQYPGRKAIRVGDPKGERNRVEVDGLDFPILEIVRPSTGEIMEAVNDILNDPADVIIVSSIVMREIEILEQVEEDDILLRRCRKALSKALTPSFGKRDLQRGMDGRPQGSNLAFVHPLFLTEQ